MENQLKQIIKHYGVLPQLKYLQSEVFELNEAIIRCEHYPGGICQALANEYNNHIAEEIADIYVMLEQFRLYYGIGKETIQDLMEYKINRQIERIENE